MLRKTAVAACVAVGFSLSLTAAKADVIVYQDLPTTLASPPEISFHNATGPVIADDFVPAFSGTASSVTWWGSAAPSGNNQWEIVLQNNAGGQPALTPPGNNVTGGIKEFATASGVATSMPGIFKFTASLNNLTNQLGNPVSFDLTSGTPYWITIANTVDGWNWAEALNGPTIGSEMFNAQQSVGSGIPFACSDGGPHCGPWTSVHTDFALQVNAVPLPGALPLFASGLAALGLLGWRRKRKAQAA